MNRVLAVLLAFCLGSNSFGQGGALRDDFPRITVQGEATVYVQPDKVVVTFGVETSEREILEAKRKNTTQVQNALATLRSLGIQDKHIQTDQLTIEPQWENSNRRALVGYVVRNNFVVTLTDVKKVESVVTAMLEKGVNHIHGIQMETTELKQHREKARTMALEAAREKATKMTATYGQGIGHVHSIVENVSAGWRGAAFANSQVSMESPGAEDSDGSISLGKIPVRAGVTVVFEIVGK